MTLTLVLGGARSGKSAQAERMAAESGLPVRYVATADAHDPAMAGRVAAHRARRPAGWETRAAEGSLARALNGAEGLCVLVDGLGVWIAARLHAAGALDDGAAEADAACAEVRTEVAALARAAAGRAESTIVVCEEAGLGVLPAGAGARRWLDLVGECAQLLAEHAQRAVLVVAGRSVELPPGSVWAPCPSLDGLRAHGDEELAPGLADHAVNTLAGGAPDWLRSALHHALDRAERYPREAEACAAVAARHGRAAEEVVPTNGAAEAFWLLPGALRPRLAACVHPSFTEPEAALRAHGVPVVRVQRDPEAGFVLDPRAVPAQADLVVVGNPNSPTGTLDPAETLLALRRPGRTLVVDEAFMDLVPGEPGTLAGEPLGDVIVVRSLTKAFAIPGVRAGYALARAPLASRLRAARPPWSANAVALAALEACAQRPGEAAAAAARAESERMDLERRLRPIPSVRVWPGAANFCLVEVPDGPGALAALRAAGIAVRPAATFPGLGPGHLRITARGSQANARVAAALAEVAACV